MLLQPRPCPELLATTKPSHNLPAQPTCAAVAALPKLLCGVVERRVAVGARIRIGVSVRA